MAVVSERSDDRHDTLLHDSRESICINTVYIADKSIVYPADNGATMAADDVHVGTRQSDGIRAKCLKTDNNLLVHEPTIYHHDHAQHVGVGDAPTVDHLRFHSQQRGNPRSRATTAVDKNLPALDCGKCLEQTAALTVVFNNGTAYLHYRESILFHTMIFVHPVIAITLFLQSSPTMRLVEQKARPSDCKKETMRFVEHK